MRLYSSGRGISNSIVIVVIIVIVILVAGVAIFASQVKSSVTTTTSTTSSVSTTSSSSSSSSAVSVSSSSTSPSVSSSISSSTSASGNGSIPTQMTIDEANNPNSMDPANALTSNAVEVTMNANLPLIFYTKGSYTTFIPVLASSWNESSNGMTYTFFLRNNVYYSNGDPFNAYVIWYNLYRVLVMNQPISFVLSGVFNSSGVTAGDLNSFNTAQNIPNSTLMSIMENSSNSITVVNATEIQFHLAYPFVAFLGTVVGPPYEFVDPYVVGQHGGVVANQPSPWMDVNGSTVGNSPYIEKNFVLNEYSVLISNPHYWAQNITNNYILMPGQISQFTLNYKTDELSRSLDLENGQVQAAVITFNDISNVLSADSKAYIPNTGDSGDMEAVLMNNEKAPLNNTLVRQAIVDAINMTLVQSSVYENYIVPVVGPMPVNLPYYNTSIVPPTYNVTKAEQLLTQAGYPGGKGVAPFTFVYPQSDYISSVAQIMVQDLSQIGLTLQPEQQSYDAYTSTGSITGNQSGAPNMYFADFTFYPDFSGYEYLVDANLGFYPYFLNSTIDSLVTLSNTQLDTTLRSQEISQITLDFNQQAGALWLGEPTDLFEVGGGFGPEVWNHCITGMWYNAAFMSVDFNSLSYTCSP